MSIKKTNLFWRAYWV